MIKTKIEFQSTWSKLRVHDFLERLFNDDDVSDIVMVMSTRTEPEPDAVVNNESRQAEEYIAELQAIEPDQTNDNPDAFTEIEKISGVDLGQIMGTNKPILTYSETKDGRVAVYYNEAATYTTLDTIRALPEKIPAGMLEGLHDGKRAAIRGFKKWLTGQDAHRCTISTAIKLDTLADIDPYAPILTGSAKVNTHASGKVEGFLE